MLIKRTGNRKAVPPRNIFFSALEGPSEDVGVIYSCLAGQKRSNLPPKEDPATFPIGSFCHQLILGTKVGTQVAKLLYEHKEMLDVSTIVAIHVWDSGDGNAPAVLFITQMYTDEVKNIFRQNKAAHDTAEMVCASEWPFNLKPIWEPVNGAGPVAGSSRSQTW